MRIGHGYDSHRFAEGRRLILGGVDSFRGAVIGGLTIGVITTLTAAYQPIHAPWLGPNFENVEIVGGHKLRADGDTLATDVDLSRCARVAREPAERDGAARQILVVRIGS